MPLCFWRPKHKVHHVLKDHPYRKLALSLRRQHQQHRPRVIGLTASYTYAIGEKKTKASLEALCRELHVVQCESATPEELHADGYYATGARAEVSLPSPSAFTSSAVAGIVPEALRKPHEMGKVFFQREKEGRSTPFAARLMACVRAMEETIAESDEVESFASPLPPAGSPAPREWGAYAHELARDERDRPMLAQLEHWYEAVKTLVVSWEEDVDIAATILDMGGCGRSHKTAVGVWPRKVRQLVSFFWGEVPTEFARFEHLKQVLKDKYKKHGCDGSSGTDGTGFRGIVFVQQRVTTHVLQHVISSDPDLKPLISPACLYAHGSRATASLSVSKAVGETNLGLFRAGLVNLLICTVVAEEGMDVPASNCVIRFDPVHHAVSLVQGRGRARQDGSSHVVLNERPDRPSHVLEREAQQQLRFVRDFKPDTRRDAAADAALLAAQRSRERGARSVLEKMQSPTFGALSAVNTFAKKTKVELEESLCKVASGLWRCTFTYESSLRKLHAFGEAPGKKIARKLAAAQLVADLLEVVPA
ncbi:unnamed protein product [Sphacelaria rigidula]